MSPILTTPAAPALNPTDQQLDKRMSGPQRHRLLQGYPMPSLMAPYARHQPYEPVRTDSARPLIVGILPHAMCAPSVKGCGYCTFPHQKFQASRVRESIRAVVSELKTSILKQRTVSALYFGGGTANLTPADSFRELCQASMNCFNLEGAEVTLEGAPAFFVSHRAALLECIRELPVRHRRISMGVQTFDPGLVEKMGRQSIGNPEQVERAVAAARARGITTSADLMINMPEQSLEQMKNDLKRASDLGFDQVCIYHLVLFRGLGTPWSKNRDMLASLPDNERAFQNWLEVTELAKHLGYQQKTLTNFERSGEYIYENCSFQPETYDAVGFGPAAISTFTDPQTENAVKWINCEDGRGYIDAMTRDGSARERCFVYGSPDLRILHLTRNLSRLEVDRIRYRSFFGTELLTDFAQEWESLQNRRLVEVGEQTVRLTPRGMFYADSVAGLLAHQRVGQLRRGTIKGANDAEKRFMG